MKGYVADIGDDTAVKTAITKVLGEFGRVDILVNCAAAVGGQGEPPLLAEITNEAFFADMNVKVMGYLRTIREVAPHMAAQDAHRKNTRVHRTATRSVQTDCDLCHPERRR